jgi:hypothetical protein
MRSKSFLELAKTLQSKPQVSKIPFDFGPNPKHISPSFESLSKIVHIPTRYEKLFEEENRPKIANSTAKLIPKEKAQNVVKRVESKPLRHIPKDSPIDNNRTGPKKLSRIEAVIREVLESRHFASVLMIDKWTITRLTLGTNEKICFIWWKLDALVEGNHADETVCLFNIVKNHRIAPSFYSSYSKGFTAVLYSK